MKKKKMSKVKKEILKTEIEENKFLLKDDMHHMSRKAEIFYERVFYPITAVMVLPLVVLVTR